MSLRPVVGAAVLLTVAALLPATSALAQLRRIPAEITPLVESDGVRPGSTVRVALQIALPDGFHVQSNKPRDPSLIPTELTSTRRRAFRSKSWCSRQAEDFKQEGLPEPLLVFEREFTLGVPSRPRGGCAAWRARRAGAPALSGVRRQDLLRAVQRADASGR